MIEAVSALQRISKGKRVKRVGKVLWAAAFMLAAAVAGGAQAEDAGSLAKAVTLPDGSMTQEGAKDVNGKWTLPDGSPTYHITTKDGKIDKLDWYAYSGFRRYHAECHVCHGPEGEGSTYAPALAKSLQTMTYGDFLGVVASGRVRNEAGTEYVMPALGDNKNVMCYVDDIYIYLKARATGAMPRGRPPGRDDKPPQAVAYDKQCLGE